jgi:hypothetical protein
MFRFHLWEPIWYYVPNTKQPVDSLKKARWLGFAHSAGDAMTYFIETEKETPKARNVILVRSIIKTRRKHIGLKEEHVNDDPFLAEFFFGDADMEMNKNDELVDEVTTVPMVEEAVDYVDDPNTPPSLDELRSREEVNIDPTEALPPEEGVNDLPLTPEEMERMYDQFEMENDMDYKFDCIVDYEFQNGILLLKTKYSDEGIGEHILTIPFPILKQDVPLELARFI